MGTEEGAQGGPGASPVSHTADVSGTEGLPEVQGEMPSFASGGDATMPSFASGGASVDAPVMPSFATPSKSDDSCTHVLPSFASGNNQGPSFASGNEGELPLLTSGNNEVCPVSLSGGENGTSSSAPDVPSRAWSRSLSGEGGISGSGEDGVEPTLPNFASLNLNDSTESPFRSPNTSVSSSVVWSPGRSQSDSGRLFINTDAAQRLRSGTVVTVGDDDVFHDADNRDFGGNSPRSSGSEDGDSDREDSRNLASGLIDWDGALFKEDIWVTAIPEDVLYHIFSFVGKSNLPVVQVVCKEWRRVAEDPKLWKDIKIKPSHNELSTTMSNIARRFGPGVQSINLRGCKFLLNRDLEALARMQQLKTLNLRDCADLTDECAVHLAACTGLQNLSMKMCKHITNVAIAEIASHCTQLRAVDLSGCTRINDESIQALAALPKLSCLKLKWCKHVTDLGMRELANRASELQVLNLRKCVDISDQGLRYLSQCPKLSALNLRKVQRVSDDGIYYLVAGPDGDVESKLSSVKLRGCKHLTGASIRHIASHCKQLKNLDMSKCRRIADSGAVELVQCANLTDINFTKCSLIGDGFLSALQNSVSRNIRDIILDGCKRITDRGVCQLTGEQIPNLRAFRVAFCEHLTDVSMEHLAKNFPSLKLLYLHGCFRLTDSAVDHISQIPKLQALSLRGCQLITNEGAAHLTRLKNMHSLDICELPRITDDGITSLSTLPNLRLLIMKRVNITDRAIQTLESFPRLMIVNVRTCKHITKAAVDELSKRKPKLQVRYLANNEDDSEGRSRDEHGREASDGLLRGNSGSGIRRRSLGFMGTVANAVIGLLTGQGSDRTARTARAMANNRDVFSSPEHAPHEPDTEPGPM